MSKSVTTSHTINKTSKSRLRLEESHTNGMTSSSISVMITSSRKLSNKRLLIKYKNSSKSQKTKIGGEPSEMSSIWKIFACQMNSLKLSTESEAAKWHPRPSPLLTIPMNFSTMIRCPCMHILPARRISCRRNGSRWRWIRFLTVCWAEE